MSERRSTWRGSSRRTSTSEPRNRPLFVLDENFPEPIHFGVHGGIRHFYQEKYGRELTGPDYPATLDHIVAGVAG